MGLKPRQLRAPKGYRFNRTRLYSSLERQRRELDISFREVGRQVGVDVMTVLRLAEGMGPTMEAYGKLCAWLDVGLDEFFD
jgi:transcriptional regulator with XRE-family HTH domain